MKKMLSALAALICFLGLAVSAYAETPAEKELTLMIYMCGSNLQSQNNCAAVDMGEMENSGMDPDKVNLLVLTGGANMKDWTALSVNYLEPFTVEGETYGDFQSQHAENFGSNMGDASTLSNYIRYCIEQYPAKQYALILWDHGEGPLGHICHDECNGNDGLSIAELAEALKNAELPQKLSWIGFDACLMSTAEVALAVSPYADYMIASQETEPETGWNYRCLKGIEEDENGAATGKRIIEAYREGNSGVAGITLSCLDLSKIQDVVGEMDAFFKPLAESLDKASFIRLSELRDSSTHFGEVVRSVDNGYDLVDLESLAKQFSAFEDASGLKKALENAVVENDSNMEGAAGLSVYHPYYNKDAYLATRGDQYHNLPFSEGYRQYVERFGAMLTGKAFADWSGIQLRDGGAAQNAHSFSLQMTEEQQQNYASAQLIILGAIGNVLSDADSYETQFSFENEKEWELECYYPVWVGDAEEGKNGLLSAAYTSRSLYITDQNGSPVAGPISYRLSDDGEQIYIFAQYQDNSGRAEVKPMVKVLYTCVPDETTGALSVVSTAVFDSVTMSYTRRLGFDEADYTDMYIDRLARCVPERDGALPAFADWIMVVDSIPLSLPLKWQLRFFDAQLSGTQLYATMQVTDTQQNSYCTPLIPVENPNLYDIDISPRSFSGDGYDLKLYAVMDNSPLEPGLNIGAEFNGDNGSVHIDSIVLNGIRDAGVGDARLTVEDDHTVFHVDETTLAGLEQLDSITVNLTREYYAPDEVYTSMRSRHVESYTAVFQVSDCRFDTVAKPPEKLLSETADGDVTLRIMDLTFNRSGDLEGLLHIVNTGDETVRQTYSIVVNELVQTDSSLNIRVAAHTDQYRRFTVRNRVVLPGFKVDGAYSGVQFGMDHVLQRYGIREIQSLRFLPETEEGNHTVFFALDGRPSVPAAENEFISVSGKPLLDGDVKVSANRVILGHRSIGIVLTAENTLDRDISLEIMNKTVDGISIPFSSGYPSQNTFMLSAGTIGILGLRIDVGNKVENAAEIAMAFRYDNLTSARAHIRLDESAALNTEGGANFGAEHFSTIPVMHRKPRILVNEDIIDVGSSRISLSMELQNYWTDEEPVEEQTFSKLLASFEIEKQSDERLTYSLDSIIINDQRCVSGLFELGTAYGRTISKTLEMNDYRWKAQLVNLKEITAISCNLHVEHADGTEEVFPLRWTIQNCSLNGIAAVDDPLGKTSENGISWELLSVKASESLKLDNRKVNESVSCTFCVRNETKEDWSGCLDTFQINHVMNPELKEPLCLPAGKEKILILEFRNLVTVDHLLQNLGHDAVENVTLYPKADAAAHAQSVFISLEKPVSLPEGYEQARRNFLEQHVLIDEDAEIGLSYLSVMNSGISLTLSMQNKTNQTLKISLSKAYAGDVALETPFYIHSSYEVLPNSTRVEEFYVSLPSGESTASLPGDIRFSLTVGDKTYENIEIRTEAPLLLGSGFLCASSQIHVVSAPAYTGCSIPDSGLDLQGFHFELGIVPCQYGFSNEEIVDFSRFKNGIFYIEDLEENEYWLPALKIYNNTKEDAVFSIWSDINGAQYQWERASVGTGDYFVAWARIKERNLDVGKYNCVFYINNVEVCSGVVDVRYKKTIFDLDTVTAGDVFILGEYEQDNDLDNGKEPIEWLVLDIQDGQALAVSRYALDCEPYHDDDMEVGWEDCSLRRWLNHSFYQDAFTLAEKVRIIRASVTADKNGSENTPEDKVFLLNVPEAEQLFSSDLEGACMGTAYCQAKGAEIEDGNCFWWLRSPDESPSNAASIAWDEIILDLGADVFERVVAVRPAIRIDLNKGFVTLGHYEQDGIVENGPEKIEWVLLDYEDGKLLLLSRYALDYQPMLLESSEEYRWSESDLRTWLNSTFMTAAFSEEVIKRLQSTELDNSSQGKLAFTGSGRYINSVLHNLKDTDRDTTYDRVFLLSYSDVCKYFPTIHSRICDVVKSVEVNIGYPVNFWYLRTPITEGNGVVTIGPDGSFGLAWCDYLYEAPHEYVRPAIWIG